MQPLTLEYIAGFVDGEGTFRIADKGDKGYSPGFSISNSNLQVLQDMRKFFCLNLKIRNQRPKSPNHKPYYELTAQSIDECKSIARLLEPHLRIKKEHAQIIMQYPMSYRIYTKGNVGCQEDFSTKAYARKLYKNLRQLNKKGPSNLNEDLQPEADPQINLLDLNQKEVLKP